VTGLLAALVFGPLSQPTAAQLWDTTFERYKNAKSIIGTIEFVQSGVAGDLKSESIILTEVAAKQPNKFSIRQTKRTGQPAIFMAASDGKQIAFTAPPDWQRMSPRARTVYGYAPEKIEGALDTFASILLDRNLPVALALYNPADIKIYSQGIRAPKLVDEIKDGGRTIYHLEASYAFSRFGPGDPTKRNGVDAWIPIQLFVTQQGDLVAMEFEESLNFRDQRTGLNITLNVVNRWNVNLQVDAAVDDSIFAIR